jgi:hypothetical protein
VIVHFPAYRRFSEARIEADDAMMVLLIGARLGEHAPRLRSPGAYLVERITTLSFEKVAAICSALSAATGCAAPAPVGV